MEYTILGGNLPVVECRLNEGEIMMTESGAMSWMSPNMKMETTSNGGFKKSLGRMFSGEKLFQNRYTATGGNGMIAFASSFPGEIKALEITPEKGIIAQKSAFLAAEAGVELSLYMNDSLSKGFLGGEGFIMQKLSGRGIAFIEIDGSIVEYTLQPGQQIVVDTGYLAAMEETVNMSVQTISGAKNILFGGEGIVNTVLTGPGKIYLQTMPLQSVGHSIAPFVEPYISK